MKIERERISFHYNVMFGDYSAKKNYLTYWGNKVFWVGWIHVGWLHVGWLQLGYSKPTIFYGRPH